MTFEEFRKEIINRIWNSEFNQYLHLYIKSKSWSDILKAFKSNGYYEWSFSNQIVDLDLLNEIPEEEREKENIYNRSVELENINSSIFLLDEANLILLQTEDLRCKIYMFGYSKLNAVLYDCSMVDLEQFHESNSNIQVNNDSFLHSKMGNESSSSIISSDFSTVKLILNDNSQAEVHRKDNSFISAIALWFSKLNIADDSLKKDRKIAVPSYNVVQKDKSEVKVISEHM